MPIAERPPRYPLAVLDADLAAPLPAVAGRRPDGQRVAGAWVLVRCHAQPLAAIVVDVPPEGLSPSALAQILRAQVGSACADSSSTVDGQSLPAGPPVTVVICTRDRPEGLARALASLRAQTHRPARVVVVDSGAAGGATRDVTRDAAADYLPVAVPGLARARNAAVRLCAGEAIAWLDDDEVADEHWFAQVDRALRERPDADVICGAIVPAELETPAQLWLEALGGMVAGRGFVEATFGPATRDTFDPLYPLPPVGAGANMVTRPGVVERVGGFDHALGAGTPVSGGEDTHLFARVLRDGGTVLYRPTLLTRHYHRRDVDDLYRQLRGYGAGLAAMYVALLRERPSTAASLLALVPRALGYLAGVGPRVQPPAAGLAVEDVPARLRHAVRHGLPGGLTAYLWGRRGDRS